jgi:diaminopimelate decarboxylase/aspartate kinase
MQVCENPPTESHPWLVMKFGGSSVSSSQRWITIAAQAKRGLESDRNVLIVVSALSGVTDLLTHLAGEADLARRRSILDQIEQRHRHLLGEMALAYCPDFEQRWQDLVAFSGTIQYPASPKLRAELLAYGELMSSAIGKRNLEQLGLTVSLQDARKWLHADASSVHTPLAVRCLDHADPEMQVQLAELGPLHITQGFIVAGPDGATCLLGRGGSDTSAACFAARLQAQALEIWTDVPGMFSADPRVVPDARLLNSLGYREAQELASMGAKVLHPPSIQPARRHQIPVFIKDTNRPEFSGTCISLDDREAQAQVKGIVSRSGITLINMEDPAMWRQAGFLADAFAVFKKHGFSVDLISTSESTVTVSLDPESAIDSDGSRSSAFFDELAGLCHVQVHKDCVSISLVGNAIRTILGKLSAALDVFQDRHVHLVTQSANDLNLTLVVDAEHAHSLVRKLHQLLIASQADGRVEFGPSWAELNRSTEPQPVQLAWWRVHAAGLADLLHGRDCAFVYHLDTVRNAARRLRALDSVSRVLYAVKANDHPYLLQVMAQEGLGFECVSLDEVRHVLQVVPEVTVGDILFTPNFAPRAEYQQGFDMGALITVDNSWALQQWPDVFAGKEIFLRLDLESGYGHHRKVITSGKDSKFGIALEHIAALSVLLSEHDIRVTGLHVHTGSGVIDACVWKEQLQRLLAVLPCFPQVRVLDLGGGIGVPDRPRQLGFDLQELDELLRATLADQDIELWLEPGRYLVAESGVLLARVTQLKDKGQYHYVGIATGMNSLIRPALYGAYHEIVNLSRLDETAVLHCRVVGPICESGDVLGESRLLPSSQEGDIILIANTGAYGRVMASHYNRRSPAEELFFGL